MNCPEGADLLIVALGGHTNGPAGLLEHVRDCADCKQQISELQQAAVALRAAAGTPGRDACLDDFEIAQVIDGVADVPPAHFAHLAVCARCRQQLAAVNRLLRDSTVASEIARLGQPAPSPWRLTRAMPVAGLLAAGLAAVLLWPASNPRTSDSRTDSARYRDRALTSTIAPRLISPADTAASGDSLVWTSVPRADRYRVTVFDRAASVVWESETSDTTQVIPRAINPARGPQFLWAVKARTGYDRWVESDQKQFTMRSAR